MTAVSSTHFGYNHTLHSNSRASLRYSFTSQDGAPVTPKHPEPQAMESGEGSEFLLYTILGTDTVA